tara:strand:- start:86 stop:493 length:408 start_codon:yes stop_codon:yes gene_type:complete
MGIINTLFKIPERVFIYFLKLLWTVISKILNILWEKHMITIWDYFNVWHHPSSYIPRLIKSIIQALKRKPSWSSRWYKLLNLLSLGVLSRLNPNPPNPKVPILLEGGFYFCHLVIAIAIIIFMIKLWKFLQKFQK